VVVRGPSAIAAPVLARKDVVFSETELRWRDWVATWEQDRDVKKSESLTSPYQGEPGASATGVLSHSGR